MPLLASIMNIPLLTRLQQLHSVQLIRKKVKTCFSKYLLITNTGICVVSGGVGDLIQQRYERLRGRQTRFNWRRSIHIMVSSAVLAPPSHYWFIVLDKVLPGRTFSTVLWKVLWDTVIATPFFIVSFLGMLRYMEGMDKTDIIKDIKDKGPVLWKAECLVYPPVQAVNFYLLPTRFRILYDSTVSLGFDVFYSFVAYKKSGEDDESSSETVSAVENKETIVISKCSRAFLAACDERDNMTSKELNSSSGEKKEDDKKLSDTAVDLADLVLKAGM